MGCIYEKKDIDSYFEELIKVQQRLIQWKASFDVQTLYELIIEVAHQKIKSIRRQLINQMKQTGLVRVVGVDRV